MKYQFTFIILLSTFLTLSAQTTYVPDDNFEQRLIDLGLDDVLDDYVLTSNISNVFGLDIQSQNISDLTGLQDFAVLKYLDASHNQFSNIPLDPDVNLNALTFHNNQLTELDLSQHTNLTELACMNNNIINLDLSQNTSLMYLTCGDNYFPELDLSNHPNLREVRLYGENPNLEYVDMRNGGNTLIQEFAVTNSPNLPYIYVDDCIYSTINWTTIEATTVFVEEEGQTECEMMGVEDNYLAQNLKIYPNPVKDNIYIEVFGTPVLIEIYSTTGVLIKASSNPNIDVSDLASGLYFAKVSTQDRYNTKRFIKL